MNNHESKAALRIDAGGIADIAKAGVERALAARKAVELTAAETQAVSGAAAVSLALIYGGRPFDILASGLGAHTLPGQLAAGMPGLAR